MSRASEDASRLAVQARRLAGTGELDGAISLLHRAVAADSGRADLHNDLGTVLAMSGRLQEAIGAFERCLALDPAHRQALGNTATALERANRLDELSVLLAEGLRRYPQDDTLLLMSGRLAARRGETALARSRLERIAAGAPPPLAREAAFALGHLHDRAGETGLAEGWFERANAAWQVQYPQARAMADGFLRELAELHETLRDWQRPSTRYPGVAASTAADPIFLLGFPRSGNTLVATMLESHGAFHVLDEQPLLDTLWADFGVALPELPRAVAGAGEARRRQLRGAYLRAAGGGEGRLIVDKSPLASVQASLLPLIFPHARIVMLQRHPYDVCLSCYMHDFPLSRAAGAFCNIVSIARFYAAVMELWLDHVRRVETPPLTVRYERIIEAPREELMPLLEATGAGWSDAILDHARRGRERARERRPNYASVSEPLYDRARERWRRYAACIEPARAILAPYVQRFGYPPG